MVKKIDPIRDNYFSAVDKAEMFVNIFFVLGYLSSILVLMIDKSESMYQAIYYAFPVITLATFIVSLISRFYLLPRATDMRSGDFLSDAYGVELSNEKTKGYYNNDFTESNDRIVAGLLENSFHTKFICQKMAVRERILTASALVIWVLCLVNRKTDLEMLAVITQAIFSEQVVSKYIRLEWLRCRSERVFNDVYKLFQAEYNSKTLEALIFQSLIIYETTKAYSGLILSNSIFEENRIQLAREWASIQKKLRLQKN